MKHTPGPWHVSSDNVQWEILNENKNEIGCVLTSDIPNDDEILANAKLMAAAPELLKALENLVDTIENIQGCSFWRAENSKQDDIEMLKEAKKIIHKALK